MAGARDLCTRARTVTDGSIPVSDGLRGFHLKVGTGFYDEKFLREVSPGQYEGFEPKLLDELARRAGFSYEFEILPKPDRTDYSWTDHLIYVGNRTDLVTFSYWVITVERERLGYASPWPMSDQSPMLAQLEPDPKPVPLGQLYFQFIQPFELSVWGVLAILLVTTAVVYWFMERKENDEDFVDPHLPACWGILRSIYLGCILWTGAGGPSPMRPAGKIALTILSFTGLLVVSAYTANLASFLIARPMPPAMLKDMNDMMAKRSTLCLRGDEPLAQGFKAQYDYSNVFDTSQATKAEALPNLGENCDVALVSVTDYERYQLNPEYAPRCKLRSAGMPLASRGGGWMVSMDYINTCKVLVRDVLRHYFLEMEDDGSLTRLIRRELFLEHQSAPCSSGGKAAVGGVGRLDLDAMAGIFIIHCVGLFFAIFVGGIDKIRTRSTVADAKEGAEGAKDDNMRVILAEIRNLRSEHRDLRSKVDALMSHNGIAEKTRPTLQAAGRAIPPSAVESESD